MDMESRLENYGGGYEVWAYGMMEQLKPDAFETPLYYINMLCLLKRSACATVRKKADCSFLNADGLSSVLLPIFFSQSLSHFVTIESHTREFEVRMIRIENR